MQQERPMSAEQVLLRAIAASKEQPGSTSPESEKVVPTIPDNLGPSQPDEPLLDLFSRVSESVRRSVVQATIRALKRPIADLLEEICPPRQSEIHLFDEAVMSICLQNGERIWKKLGNRIMELRLDNASLLQDNQQALPLPAAPPAEGDFTP